MSTGKMRLQYHPVLKKMKFERYENGRWTDANESSKLREYVNQSTQLLQNFGDAFFQDIVDSMDKITDITLDFKGTREDYEDLKKMIEHYQKNKEDQRSLSVGELTELAAVKDLFEDITCFSNEISNAFRRFIEEAKGDQRQKEVGSICDSLEEWLDDLDKKREGLAKDAVNLCFVGGYSSGKSTLINALVGESILPEAIRSETAKMFKITQIRKGSDEDPSISFHLAGTDSRDVKIKWNGEGQASLIDWPVNNPVREAVQSALNETVGKALHLQVKTVLTVINKQPGAEYTTDKETGEVQTHDSYIKGIVDIRYPFDLDAGVLFHIYDTPGTDSNNPDHLETLKTALDNPASSILVYVNDPVKMEGTANSILLNILEAKDSPKDGREKTDNSTIDLSRSFFVINKADTLKDETALRDLRAGSLLLNRTESAEQDRTRTSEGKEETAPEAKEAYQKPFEIKLSEKRLFFTDALHAGDARAVAKGIAGGEEEQRLKEWECLVNTNWRHLYQYDRMALADADTEKLIAEADAELGKLPDPKAQIEEEKKKWSKSFAEAARQGKEEEFVKEHPMPTEKSFGPRAEAYYICSGVYSLQKEIERYAERFALAVRAKGIIDGTQGLIQELQSRCRRSELTLNTNINSLQQQIHTIEHELTGKIEDLCREFGSDEISVEEERRLGLDSESIVSKEDFLKSRLREAIGSEFILGSKKYKDMEERANNTLREAIESFSQNYFQRYPKYLDETQDALIKEIERKIQAQKGLDQSTKDRLKNIQKPKTKKRPSKMKEINFENARFRILRFINYINIDRLIDDAITQFRGELNTLKDQYKKQFADMKRDTAEEIKGQYQGRVKEFAGEVICLENDRDGFERELEKLKKLLEDVENRNKTLTDKINKEVEKEGKA